MSGDSSPLEAALQTQLNILQQHLPAIVWIRDVETEEMTFLSDAYETIMGRPAAAMKTNPMDWLEAVHPDDRDHAQAGLAAWGQNPDDNEPMKIRIVVDGKEKWISTQVLQIKDGANVKQLVGITLDITSEVQVQELERQEHEKAQLIKTMDEREEFKTNFLNMAAHDLATPLTPLRLQIASLRIQAKLREDDRELLSLDVLDRNVSRLGGLIQDILEVARIKGDHLQLKTTPVDLRAAALDAIQTVQESANYAGIQITLDDASQPRILADENKLSQMLLNLLTNAIKFTPDGGPIQINITTTDGCGQIEVTDSGRGISKEDAAKLFGAFTRVGDQASVKGTGLGLHITKGLAEAHGGAVWATSKGLGHGSTFGFRIPLAQG